MPHAYLFETRGIQRFLFATGLLRDVISGSELLDHVCAEGGLLDQTLSALGVAAVAPRRAGATFYLLFDDIQDAGRFRAAWRLAFPQWVPGVESVDALVEGASAREAIDAGVIALRDRRNTLAASLPRPGPLDGRSQRTGRAATLARQGEHLDATTSRLRAFSSRPGSRSSLEQRFLDSDEFQWPRTFEDDGSAALRFPLLANRLIGVVHADGNGIGTIVRKISEATRGLPDADFVRVYRGFSDGLNAATQAAAREATRTTLVAHAVDGALPARPLVLGGDDVTLLVRSDLALPYTRAFLLAFERETTDLMSQLRQWLADMGQGKEAGKLPANLTASAGICYCKSSYPFRSAYALAESLGARAKHRARDAAAAGGIAPSTVAFHKMEGAVAEDASTLHTRLHQVGRDGASYLLALPAYAIEQHRGMPSLDQLEALAAPFQHGADGLNDKPLRDLATLLRQDVAVAKGAYSRWRELASRSQPGLLRRFDDALEQLLGDRTADLPAGQGEPALSPLSDLLVWLSIQQGKPELQGAPS